MKKIILSLALFLLLPVAAVKAHEIKTSGTLDILLHMEPLDDPAAGEPGEMYFGVSDSAEKFKFADCACTATVAFEGQELLRYKITAADEAPDWGANVARVNFTFPKIGIYQVTIEGSSNNNNSFAPFKLEYDKRIERGTELPLPGEDEGGLLSNYYVIGGAVLLFGIITYGLITKPRKK